MQRKLEASWVKKRRTLGLLEPGEKALLQERAAYNVIAVKDETTIAWILKQKLSAEADFFTALLTPYYTAANVLDKARALGN